MDQKALSHLDPKARETYDRVMGTASAVESAAQPPSPTTGPAATSLPDSGFVPLTPPDSSAGLAAPMQPPAPQPIDPGFNSGPADLSMAGMTPTLAEQPTADPSIFSANPVTPDAQNNGSSFFTNPSPNSAESSASSSAFSALPSSFDTPAPDTTLASDTTAPMTPITPYTPVGLNDQQPTGMLDQAVQQQPLPSPAAAVNQPEQATHQSSALLKVLYIVAAVVFFAIYTIFWIKVFNLPFLF